MGTERLPETSNSVSRQFRADQHSIVKRTTNMIKRARSTKNASPKGLSRAEHAALNKRPAELNTAPHDPDSETAWMADGNCRLHPPATFFPSDGVGVDRARKICKECPVVGQCLEYALDSRIDHGVWGACSERERRRILKRRREDAVVNASA
jgi:WhiB family transcriptional regulator, redox-sensing transcriptional regulator